MVKIASSLFFPDLQFAPLSPLPLGYGLTSPRGVKQQKDALVD